MEARDRVRDKLGQVRRLIRLGLLGVGAGQLAATVLCLAAFSFLVDRWLRLDVPSRALLSGLCLAVGACQAWRHVIRPLACELPDAELALEVERRWGGRCNLIVSALQFWQGGRGTPADALARLTVARAAADCDRIQPARLVRWTRVRRSLLLALVCLCMSALLAIVSPDTVRLWAARNVLLGVADWPRRTHLALLDADAGVRYVPRGEDAVVSVRAGGVIPRVARMKLRYGASGETRTVLMERVGHDVFRTRIPSMRESCTLSVRAGDGVVPAHRMEVEDRPRVVQAHVAVRPPDYISKAESVLPWNAGVLPVPAGSDVRFELACSKPLRWATLTRAADDAVRMTILDATTARASVHIAEDVPCSFALCDTHGMCTAEPLRLLVKAVPDRAPVLTVEADGLSDRITPQARLPLRVRASDDYGMDRAWVECAHEPDGGRRTLFEASLVGQGDVAQALDAPCAFDLAALGLPVGGRVTCVAYARDQRATPAPNLRSSEPLTFRIVDVRELTAALLVRQRDVRQDIERQADRQRGLIRRIEGSMDDGGLPAGAAAMAPEQGAVAHVLDSAAKRYGQVLRELFNNRVIGSSRLEENAAGIVDPLIALAAEGGPISEVSAGLSNATSADSVREQLPPMQDVLRQLETVRARMLLLETYAEVIVVVSEITDSERSLLDRTREEYIEMLRRLPGER